MRAGACSALECANRGARESHFSGRNIGWTAIASLHAPLQLGMAMPVVLYLGTLTIMLFRPPDVEFYSLDRVAFVVLVFLVLLRALAVHQLSRIASVLVFPMVGLAALASVSAFTHPYQASAWSVMTAKYMVPFAMFWVAGMTFRDERSFRWLERFCLLVLAYLTFTAIMFLTGTHELIFPSYILDESIGINADRARGPFLQAVANGMTLNILGLLAIASYHRRRLRGIWALGLLPLLVAIVATKTRAVWLSFAVSVTWLLLRDRQKRLRSACIVLALAGVIGLLFIFSVGETGGTLEDRLQDRNTVEFRMAAYQAAWEMFLAEPLKGRGAVELKAELADRIRGFRGESFGTHNTYLEILLEHGIVGIALYGWLMVALFRLGRKRPGDPSSVASLRRLWPLLLVVFLVNAIFVVMNYLFVNGLLFTFAGILVANTGQAQWKEAGVRPSI